jgi:hypothetical protein
MSSRKKPGKQKSDVKQKYDRLTTGDTTELMEKLQKEFKQYNSQQFIQIRALSDIFKEFIEDEKSPKTDLERKCVEGVQILRNFVTLKNSKKWTEIQMSDLLTGLYTQVDEFIGQKLKEFDDESQEKEFVHDEFEDTEIDQVMSNWYAITVTVKSLRRQIPHEDPDSDPHLDDDTGGGQGQTFLPNIPSKTKPKPKPTPKDLLLQSKMNTLLSRMQDLSH